jgi:hypothetical protein
VGKRRIVDCVDPEIDFSDTVITANCNFHGMQDCGRCRERPFRHV